jgi:hypothetical protein
MQSCEATGTSVTFPKATPFLLRLVSKLVLEVLPAGLASMIGAMLLAHYHFTAPARSAGGTPAAAAPASSAPASPAMVRLVRDEHDQIRDFLAAQQAAQNSRYATADAEPTPAAPAAELAATAARRATTVAAAKPRAARAKTVAFASISPAPAPNVAAPAAARVTAAPLAIAGLQDNAAPATEPAPAHGSLVATTLAMKDHVVSATLHAVMAIGGIPSWIGHRLGGNDPDSGDQAVSAAS